MRLGETFGFVVILGLAAAIVLQLRATEGAAPAVTQRSVIDSATITVAGPITLPTSTVTAPRVGYAPPTTSAPTTTTPPVDPQILVDTQAALDAWGRFATNGDMTELWGRFAVGGPQRLQLFRESAELAANPLGDPPYLFTMSGPEVVQAGDVAFVTAAVDLARTGEDAQTFRWLIEVRYIKGSYQLWTVTDL